MTGNVTQRLLLRAARRIHKALQVVPTPQPLPFLSDLHWSECRNANRRMQLAAIRGWQTATARMETDFRHQVTALICDLELYRDQFDDNQRPPIQPVGEIYKDLMTLQSEFDGVRIDFTKQELVVTTDSIVLGDLNLGPFEIVVGWKNLQQPGRYQVKAVDARPAGSDSRITHPHVHDDGLCEGDGQKPIRHALKSGRLLDFCLLVRQILKTYNAGSAYALLEEWDGTECPECGDRMSDNTQTSCSRCDRDLCVECISTCASCHSDCCSDCLSTCNRCGGYCCSPCLAECSGCGESFCSKCLPDDQCPACRNSEQEPDEDDSLSTTEASTDQIEQGDPDPADQPVRLGEAAVPT